MSARQDWSEAHLREVLQASVDRARAARAEGLRAGFVCKLCDGPSPLGIGYAVCTPEAFDRSVGVSVCPCGYSDASGFGQ